MKARLLILLIYMIFISGCFGDCGYLEEKKYAESLTTEQLSNIYTEVSNLAKDPSIYRLALLKDVIDESNKELSIMNFHSIFLDKERAYITLGGCFDDKAVLEIEGINKKNGSITLFSGEHSYFEKKMLWKTIE